MHTYFRVRACIHPQISAMRFVFTQSKCHINIVLNWYILLIVKSMEIVSEEHVQLNAICVQIQRVPGATRTFRPQPKRRCTVPRAPQARAKKILRILNRIQFLYFALVLQSHSKYFNHEETVQSLKNWKYFTSITTFICTPISKRAMCVF